jgi:alpha-glucosidase
MNEPSNCIYDALKEEYSMRTVVDQNGELWEPRLRNVYGLGMAQAAFEGVRRAYPGKRPFVLTRSGLSGYQRFAATWTGDNHSTWEHLWLSIPMLLNLGLSGVTFCGADVGGFAGDTTPELLVRWYQMGCFYPFFRNHSNMNTARQEPWAFGNEVEKLSREAISLRYHLLRYIYSLAWCAGRTGIPLMRPVFLHFQDDEETWDIDNQFMLGPFVLVAPVVEEGKRSREVYLPSCSWFDFWSDNLIDGPARFTQDAPLDRVPIYVRGGAIIPAGQVIQSSDEDQGDLLLLVYPLGEGEFTLYEDDGVSQDGSSSTTLFRVESSGKSLHMVIGARSGSWKPSARNVVLEFRGLRAAPTRVSVDRRSKRETLNQRGERRYSLTMNDDGQHHDIRLEWK